MSSVSLTYIYIHSSELGVALCRVAVLGWNPTYHLYLLSAETCLTKAVDPVYDRFHLSEYSSGIGFDPVLFYFVAV